MAEPFTRCRTVDMLPWRSIERGSLGCEDHRVHKGLIRCRPVHDGTVINPLCLYHVSAQAGILIGASRLMRPLRRLQPDGVTWNA